MDRERTADMVRSVHPNGPISNCVEGETNTRERSHPSGPSTMKFFSYLVDMLLHKQQQVIEVIKYETGHLKKEKKKRLSHKRGQTHLQSFLFHNTFCPLLMTQTELFANFRDFVPSPALLQICSGRLV